MTATTALTYGYDADAYALYPGITRGREENHLWLPPPDGHVNIVGAVASILS